MKLVAAIAIVAAALVLPAAQAAPSKTFSPVLGLDLTKKGMHRLAWFSPGDLTMLHGRKAPLGRYVGTWVFSPDRSTLAVQAADTTGYQQQAESEVRLVNVRSMRRVGRIDLGSPRFWLLGWVRSDRLLALVFGDSGNFLAVVDPGTRRVVSRTPLTGPLERCVSLPNAVACCSVATARSGRPSWRSWTPRERCALSRSTGSRSAACSART